MLCQIITSHASKILIHSVGSFCEIKSLPEPELNIISNLVPEISVYTSLLSTKVKRGFVSILSTFCTVKEN